jgi:hypothetical protein
MRFDYCAAAKRHWDAAEVLNESGRVFGADQLFGLAAECALKAIMVGFGAHVESGDLVEKSHRNHIDLLWSEFQCFARGRSMSRYLTPLQAFRVNPFADWSIIQRYLADADLPSGSALDLHRKASRACKTALQRALDDGRVVP